MTSFVCQTDIVSARRQCEKIEDVGDKTAKTVTNISKLSPTEFVSNIDVTDRSKMDHDFVRPIRDFQILFGPVLIRGFLVPFCVHFFIVRHIFFYRNLYNSIFEARKPF